MAWHKCQNNDMKKLTFWFYLIVLNIVVPTYAIFKVTKVVVLLSETKNYLISSFKMKNLDDIDTTLGIKVK